MDVTPIVTRDTITELLEFLEKILDNISDDATLKTQGIIKEILKIIGQILRNKFKLLELDNKLQLVEVDNQITNDMSTLNKKLEQLTIESQTSH